MDPNQNDEYLDADENEDDLLDERNIVRVIDLPDEGIIGKIAISVFEYFFGI